jgi:hypothetical protein
MRGLKSTIALAVILVALIGYIYFVESKKPASGEETKEKVFTVVSDQIEELRIKAASGETSHLRKGTKGWELIEPTQAKADSSEMSSITSNLSSVEMQRVVENPGDTAQYGLNPARVDVAFRTKGEKDFRHLNIGEKTPTGGDLYATKPGDKRVFLISSFLDSTFNRTPFDLRDKTILAFERDKVDSLEVVKGTTTMQFAHAGTDWKIVKPISVRADYGAIEGLVTRLSSGQMKKLVATDATDLKPYGLDPPALTATVSTGSSRASLALGKTEDDATYARDISRPLIFTVEKSLGTDLEKDVSEYRRKDVFDFRSFNANRAEIHRGADTSTFEKTKDKDGKDIWRSGVGKTADTAKVEDMLTKFSNLRAQSFETAPNPALKTPAVTVTVKFDDSKTETVTLARSGSDVYASRADEPGSAKLETTPYEDAIKALDALK